VRWTPIGKLSKKDRADKEQRDRAAASAAPR
jgi:hypothetical protein